MVKQEFQTLIASIESGGFTPDQMEDVLQAMHTAYKLPANRRIYMQSSFDLQEVGDQLALARGDVEFADSEEDAADLSRGRTGYVRTVANVAGVSLEVAA